MSGNKGPHRRGYHNKHNRNEKAKPNNAGEKSKENNGPELDENSEVIKLFREYATELDTKHDRYERLVKLSRDTTIESKRIIFLLHNYNTASEMGREQLLGEADLRLKQLVEKNFEAMALELEDQDHFLFNRAISAGVQEFIEALTFFNYLKFSRIETCANVLDLFTFDVANVDGEATTRRIVLHIPMHDYFQGLADFTGELMRKCINNLGSGNIDDCFAICNYTKDIYSGFMGVGPAKDFGRKISVLRQSLLKMEYVCYNLRVRGSEVPKHMLANVIPTSTTDGGSQEDEGFY